MVSYYLSLESKKLAGSGNRPGIVETINLFFFRDNTLCAFNSTEHNVYTIVQSDQYGNIYANKTVQYLIASNPEALAGIR